MVGPADGGGQEVPATPLDPLDVPAVDAHAFEALVQRVEQMQALDAAGLRAAFPATFRETLGYDPATAGMLDTIQASALALSDGEYATLGQNGFVVSTRREFPTFLRGLAEIYSEHLPVYVTADALLEAVHSSYDTMLLEFERSLIIPELSVLLRDMQARLGSIDAEPRALADADLYLSVARGLLEGRRPKPVYASAQEVDALISMAESASGIADVKLFGSERMEDFSQFTPRGHYTGEPMLENYFRAMMWLGRVDLRLLETLPHGSQVFRRDQYLAMLLLHDLVAPDLERFQRIDEVIRTFVGESDYLKVSEVGALVADLGGPEKARLAKDQEVAAAIVAGGYGKQQIASHLMINANVVKTLPLNRSFALFGQRYVVDSHVFSEAVYDRVEDRMMASPLDAAFAALGNDHALALHPELDMYPELPGALGRMRVLIDAHDENFWDANFYNLWLSALRALSKPDDPTTLPALHQTELWGRRLLNTQLGSWAELRHDTLLYAKQSYTTIPGCEFPDAYVDPYPAFYTALLKYAQSGSRLVELATDPDLARAMSDYFSTLARAATVLGDMAERQLRGEPYTDEQLAFINDAVRIDKESVLCATIDVPNGWYADLFFQREKSIKFDPTIADVHTQPAEKGGVIVGKVLHVGTGYPRLMVATVDTCNGPRAYAGVVYAYHEHITRDFERLTDEQWASRIAQSPRPDDVPWLQGVLSK